MCDGYMIIHLYLVWCVQAFLVAIVVLDPELLPGWAQQRGIEGSYTELCQNKVSFPPLVHQRRELP